jgi:predicted acyltransferase
MNPDKNYVEKNEGRLEAIDQYRGFAILLMVLADYLSRIERVPSWLKHASGGVGLTVVDLIAPMFILAIGLSFRPSWRRRLSRDGRKAARLHFIRRFLALMGIGFLTPRGFSWGLLQAIGGAGLIALVFIELPSLPRAVAGGIIMGGYQILAKLVWMGRVTGTSSWCEIEGTLGWAAMLILASVLADFLTDRPRGRKLFLLGSGGSLGMGIILSFWIQISQYFVSTSYVLISLGLSGIIFATFDILTENKGLNLPLLIAWGKNPLVLYLLHYWIWVYAFIAPQPQTWYYQAPSWLILLQAGGFVSLLSLVAWYLDRQKWILSL